MASNDQTKEAAKAVAEASDKTTINLQNDITVNGVKFRAGQGVEVPKRQADDLLRMDYEHNQYLAGLNKKRTMEVDAGTIGVGGGAE